MEGYKIHVIHKDSTEPQLLYASNSIKMAQEVFRSLATNNTFISQIGTMELLKVNGAVQMPIARIGSESIKRCHANKVEALARWIQWYGNSELIRNLWNCYVYDDTNRVPVFRMKDFDLELDDKSPTEIAQLIKGNDSFALEEYYFGFDGFNYITSSDSLSDFVCEDELAAYVVDHPDYFAEDESGKQVMFRDVISRALEWYSGLNG